MAGHDHEHDHDHEHGHHHHHPAPTPEEAGPALDLNIPDGELNPAELRRRGFLRSAGLLGAGAATIGGLGLSGSTAAAADARTQNARTPKGGYHWLAGDHHIHTQYSEDAQYLVIDHVRHANAFGLDWMVITDHGSAGHAKIGVEKVNPDIKAARTAVPDTLVFQGLEWNIPSAEHGTVFVHPGSHEVEVLKAFENTYDGAVKSATASSPANEKLALQGLHFLADAVDKKRVQDALFLANHPARKGLDSPHEIRGWRDAAPGIAIGFEGAPGHQAAGIATEDLGAGSGRGFYDNSPTADSFAAYPLESYRTFGGFDWMTATVGGLWDSLLSEGKPWWITANSDSHQVWLDLSQRPADTDFAKNGFHNPPVYAPKPATANGDFWPGFYSRTHVGASSFSYASVMAAMRAGRVWVDHGGLIESLDIRLRAGHEEVPLGGVLHAKKGSAVTLVVNVTPAQVSNWADVIPALKKIDLIRGSVTGAVPDKDIFTAPKTKVVKTWDVSGKKQNFTLTCDLGPLEEGFYVRLRGSDGNRVAVGLNGKAVDPAGPKIDVVGDANPWQDLWFYTNPLWALPR